MIRDADLWSNSNVQQSEAFDLIQASKTLQLRALLNFNMSHNSYFQETRSALLWPTSYETFDPHTRILNKQNNHVQ